MVLFPPRRFAMRTAPRRLCKLMLSLVSVTVKSHALAEGTINVIRARKIGRIPRIKNKNFANYPYTPNCIRIKVLESIGIDDGSVLICGIQRLSRFNVALQ